MRNDTINAQPIEIDWADAFSAERAEIIYPAVAELALADIEELACDLGLGIERAEDEDEDDYTARIAEEVQEQCSEEPSSFEPQMNYAYPLPGLEKNPELYQNEIAFATSCCLVMLDDEPVLALTGGGMDLSWDICQAYTILGLLPPLHFASNLPKMMGMSYLENRKTLEACQRTAEIAVRWAQNAVAGLNRLEMDLKANDAKKSA